jgi:hypothetical protein
MFSWFPENSAGWRWFYRRTALLALLLAAGAAYLVYLTHMPGRSYLGDPPPLSAEESAIADNLRRYVAHLADTIGERNGAHYPALQASADYLAHSLAGLGHAVEFEDFPLDGETYRNIRVRLPGASDEILLIGAHYDSAPDTPGANDNGSGVAALLELARLLAGRPLARSVHLVAFVNEEPPHFGGEFMGSRVYAKAARQRGDAIVGMFSLETLGYYAQEPGSQSYPLAWLSWLYPDRGDFIGFVGNTRSRELVRRSVEVFRQTTEFPAEGIAAPNWVPGINLSDHQSFWGQGYPALMVTDTAPFRYPYYHTPADTPDKLDYARTARVVLGLSKVILALAGKGESHE